MCKEIGVRVGPLQLDPLFLGPTDPHLKDFQHCEVCNYA